MNSLREYLGGREGIGRTLRATLSHCAIAVVFAGAGLLGGGAAHADTGGVEMTATIDDRDIGGASGREPIQLTPDSTARIAITLTNNNSEQIEVRRVGLTGHVLGLNFFSYSTAVGLEVAPGKTETLSYALDLAGLDGQATGLISGRLTVSGADGEELASVATVTDVRGSMRSVYGLFGIALAVLTALAAVDAALGIARHRLSANRWQRGVRLLAPGVGVGLIFGFTASVLRWWVPATGLWLAVAGGAAAVGFLLGYLSPTPATGSEEPDAEDIDFLGGAGETPVGSVPHAGPVA
ncbi:hypothetical protein [Nocardia bhagyanarayanae]|uniref:Uncharacterized protein n=1 Tax=Nocardia bhagyanarayanae TaxID=1215925 RepID=A0A543FF47_9NOCA|nr:hypothetical protein [Nocardia bhagyanarayanae]TQM32488.1 hypothetical protein FB390_4171 [Nocardia bhagyanarayanae]